MDVFQNLGLKYGNVWKCLELQEAQDASYD